MARPLLAQQRMSLSRVIFGKTGEDLAVRELERRGYAIVARRYRRRGGELDIIARDGPTLVFVEVKARSSSEFGGAVHAVDRRKQARLVRVAAHYLAQHRLANQPCRFDVILCDGGSEAAVVVEHIEHAFDVPGDDLRW